MSKTRLQLAHRALTKLGVVGVGQDPSSEDTATIDDIIDAVAADLEAREIYAIADIDDIDDAPFEWIAEYLAFMAAPDFSLPMDDNKRQRAEYMLKWVNSSGPTYKELESDYF